MTASINTVLHLATRANILATRTGSLRDYTASGDNGAFYRILGPVPGDADSVYAVGLRHDNIVLVTRTGRVDVRGRGAQNRVRIMFAHDTGDLAGTLSFDRADGIGGVAPRVLFG